MLAIAQFKHLSQKDLKKKSVSATGLLMLLHSRILFIVPHTFVQIQTIFIVNNLNIILLVIGFTLTVGT